MDLLNFEEIFKQLDTLDKNDDRFTEICINVAQAINEKQTTIQKVVENTGFLLVNQSADKREVGTFLLSQILVNLPDDFLTSTELHFISSFYCDRLKDNHQVIPAVLIGIHALIQMTNLPEGAPHKLLSSLFENVPCQQQQMKDRQLIYQIFREILQHRTQEINAMGIDYVLGVLQSIDGERDPRNLQFLFNWLPSFLTTVSLGHLTEEMFDVIACYFPVDFKAPPQDTQSITREGLSSALCPCLCAVPVFAEHCLPLIIDKLNSSLKIAKLDSLHLLTESCKTFDVGIYEQHSHDIWNILQKETLNSSDSELEEAALNCISGVINRLSENPKFLTQTIDNLYDTLKGNLRPDTKLFLPSSKILISIARASKQSCQIVAQPTVALLLNHYNLTKDYNQKEILFRTLMEFTVAYLKLYDVTNITEIQTLNEIPTLCFQGFDLSNNLQVISYESCARIAKTLPETCRSTVYQLLKTKIIQRTPEPVRCSILKCFKTFANLYKQEIIREFLNDDYNNYKTDLVKLELYLEALSCIVVLFPEIILPQILSLCVVNTDVKIAKISIKCLTNILQENHSNPIIQQFLFNDCNVIDKLLNWILSIIDAHDCNLELLENISLILKFTVGHRTIDEQTKIIQLYYKQLFGVYQTRDYKIKHKIIILMEGLVTRIRPGVVIEEKYFLIKELLQNIDQIQENVFLYACMIIANIINKSCEDETFIQTLNEIDTYVTNSLDEIKSDLHLHNLIQLISWLTKALIIKGSNRSDVWTDKLILLLEKYENVGKSFRLIMDDSHDCLTAKSYCTNRLLYRQKFFAYVCKKISNTYNEDKPNYLLALGYLLQLAPLQVIILYFKETLRLLIFCLEQCKDVEALCAVLNTLRVLIHEKEPYLENHIDDLLPRFINLTVFEGSMKVRIAALQCIKEFPQNYPIFKLLPHKQEVIHGLSYALDDKKRLVRRDAVEARTYWFLLDAPT